MGCTGGTGVVSCAMLESTNESMAVPNQTTVPATSAELLLLWFCGARNAKVVKEVAEDKLNISLFPLITSLNAQYSAKIAMSCLKV